MVPFIEALLYLIAALLLIPLGVLVIELLVALWPGKAERDSGSAGTEEARPTCAVIIPAHNEEAGITPTLAALRQQLRPGDRLVVVADNCSDRTAEVARSAGGPAATVLERQDAERRGKGYALDFGVRSLEADPPGVVVIVDADCLIQPGCLDHLLRQAAATNRPAQAAYTLAAPPESGHGRKLSAFAVLLKNVIRPLGLYRMGLPCMLTGSGMAFPWAVLRTAHLASGNIVEDMKLSVDLALAGHPAQLCPPAWVTSALPTGQRAAGTQRTRWEHGHLQTLLTQSPRLAWAGLRRGKASLLGLALELGVPPLSILGFLWAVALAAAGVWWLLDGTPYPALILAAAGAAVLVFLMAAWFKFGREQLPFSSLLAAPFYMLGKVPIYLNFLFARMKVWVPTERDRPAAGQSGDKAPEASPTPVTQADDARSEDDKPPSA